MKQRLTTDIPSNPVSTVITRRFSRVIWTPHCFCSQLHMNPRKGSHTRFVSYISSTCGLSDRAPGKTPLGNPGYPVSMYELPLASPSTRTSLCLAFLPWTSLYLALPCLAWPKYYYPLMYQPISSSVRSTPILPEQIPNYLSITNVHMYSLHYCLVASGNAPHSLSTCRVNTAYFH